MIHVCLWLVNIFIYKSVCHSYIKTYIVQVYLCAIETNYL